MEIKNKRILITGGTGSFGSTMVKALLDFSPKEIIVFSRDELKQFEMRNKYPSHLIKFVIGDVRDIDRLRMVMDDVDYVFSAAALKQVPIGEFFPLEVVKTNILGTFNVMRIAMENKVKRVVVLSTDKAVYPINAMGMSKALMEKSMIALAQESKTDTIFSGVRYGNVMYSRGSVIPYFVDLIKQNKKLRVTNLSMTRFLLPLSDSVRLVLHALSDGKNGSVYVKKAPSADMETLAKAICQIFEYKKGYEVVGVRAGEKIHETLVSKEEWRRVKDQKDFYEIPPEFKTLEYEKFFKGEKKDQYSEKGYTSENAERLNVSETVKLLLTLPEIKSEVKKYKNERK